MDLSGFIALADRCGAGLDARPLREIVRKTSGFEPLSLTIDVRKPIKILATSKDEAVALATQAKVGKQDVRLGLAGLTFGDLDKAGIGIVEAFEVCPALRAAAKILESDPKHFASPKTGGVQYSARARPSTDDESGLGQERPIPREDRVAARPEQTLEKPWDVFGNASGKSLLVYEAAAPSPR